MWSDRRRVLTALLAAGMAQACASNSAPHGFLPTPEEAQESAFGGWIELTLSGKGRVEGELLAVSADSVWVLADSVAEVVSTGSVVSGRLTGYRWASEAVVTGTFVGVLSTLSNGYFLVFTAPLWIIVGNVAGGAEARAAQRRTPPFQWTDLALFARFPQGLPPGLSLDSLKPDLE